ncbi:fibrinogen-like protein 1 isoform X3 [Bactrocera dorsalis]|uniref:Fibrinogen-like protein 1 isoform X3 n=1 Tax=Bactrocera dorsalis TaxID=27457 RepID=A0ABM3JFG8_BACDO|nr:fibrinogen-like protein 1 isoform X3 [Bactrocera dorsalis]
MCRQQWFSLLLALLLIYCCLGAIRASIAGNDDLPMKYIPSNCNEAVNLAGSKAKSGIYKIGLPQPQGAVKEFYVYCLLDPLGGEAWTLIQRRQDASIHFYRGWEEYKNGFGNLNTNFFIGLDKLHALTESQLHELWIELKDFDGVEKHAMYDSFAITDEDQKYAMNILGTYSGTAGDDLTEPHGGAKFSTFDQKGGSDCADLFKGGWWYGKGTCVESHLNGVYHNGSYNTTKAEGIIWSKWHGSGYSMKYVHMAIRPKDLRIGNKSVN